LIIMVKNPQNRLEGADRGKRQMFACPCVRHERGRQWVHFGKSGFDKREGHHEMSTWQLSRCRLGSAA